MKRTRFIVMSLCVAAWPAVALAQLASGDDANPITAAAKTQAGIIKGFVVKAAEKMPEDQYSFKPTPEVRSFGAILGHIANANYMICSRAASAESPSKDDIEKTVTAKADLVKALNESFAYCEGVLAKLDDKSGTEKVKFFFGDQPKIAVMWFGTAHNYEHYGNLVTYLRLKGLVPPSSERGSM